MEAEIRVNFVFFCRAVYKDADIYLLDDPLSAVDTHVGKHLFEDCVCGYLKNKTVVLVTHQLQYLQNVDNIVILNNVSIIMFSNFMFLLLEDKKDLLITLL